MELEIDINQNSPWEMNWYLKNTKYDNEYIGEYLE